MKPDENQPRILEFGKTPAEWCAIFADRGIEISERTLREKARSTGHYHILGRAMMLLPEHIDAIFNND